MQRIRLLCSALRRDERGLTTVEYAIILCVIVAVSVKLWGDFGDELYKAIETSTDNIDEQLDRTR